MRFAVMPSALRDTATELLLVRQVAVNPDWLDAGWSFPAEWLACAGARRVYERILTMHEHGERVSLDKAATLEGVSPRLFWTRDLGEVGLVPDLARWIHRLDALRQLRMLALALAHRTEQPAADPVMMAAALRELLEEVAVRCPLPRRRAGEVAA